MDNYYDKTFTRCDRYMQTLRWKPFTKAGSGSQSKKKPKTKVVSTFVKDVINSVMKYKLLTRLLISVYPGRTLPSVIRFAASDSLRRDNHCSTALVIALCARYLPTIWFPELSSFYGADRACIKPIARRDVIIIVTMKSQHGSSSTPSSAVIERQLERTCDQLHVLHSRIEMLRVRQKRFASRGYVYSLQMELQVVEAVYAVYYKYGAMKAGQLMELDQSRDTQDGDLCDNV